MNIKYFVLSFFCFFLATNLSAQEYQLNILVFSKTAAFKHKSIPVGIEFLSKMASNNHWKISFSTDATDFTVDNLFKYNTLVFLNTSGNLFDEDQKQALKTYMASGRGFVGIHAASDTEKEWDWYGEMVGAVFSNHPKIQKATLNINKAVPHPATNELKAIESFTDEWYNFKKPVGKHVTVLASLDESSYEGQRMGMEHPISWYHLYDGGRVFYTGLGHTNEVYTDSRFYKHIEGAILWAANKEEDVTLSKKWTALLQGDLHTNWDVFMGAPHATVQGLENVDPKSNGMNATPLGLNNDPKKVFSLETLNGEQVLHISGEIYGALTSKKEYKNYHLKLQFKWGDKLWAPRLDKPRDSGILYHCTGPYAKFWKVWMQSQEFQVQEGDVGDYYSLSGTEINIPSIKKEGAKEFDFVKDAALNKFSSIDKAFQGHCNKGFNNEKPHGEWNTLELICFEGNSLHIVNGEVVMALFDSKYKTVEGQIIPLQKGRIQIQSEAAEIFYKNIEIKTIDGMPSKYKKFKK